MATVFDKLNLKHQKEILVIAAPESFESELQGLNEVHIVSDINALSDSQFVLAFVTKQAEVDTLVRQLVDRIKGDGLLWFAYPKASSKRYTCDFNRDTGWKLVRSLGFDSVRQVAIDEDWSALRFRRIEYIKS
jgi:hypothetical protein